MISGTNLPPNILRCMDAAARKPLGKAGLLPSEVQAAAEAKAELDLQGDIAGYLRLHDIEYIKPDGRKKSPLPPGWPDFTFCYRGIAIGMEVKTATGRLSGDQMTQHARMAAPGNGWRMVIVRSLPEVQALLRAIDAEVQPPVPLSNLRAHSEQSPALAIKERQTGGQDRPSDDGPGAQFLSQPQPKS